MLNTSSGRLRLLLAYVHYQKAKVACMVRLSLFLDSHPHFFFAWTQCLLQKQRKVEGWRGRGMAKKMSESAWIRKHTLFASSWAPPLLAIGIFSSNSFATGSQWYSNAVCPMGYICCFSGCATTLSPAHFPHTHTHKQFSSFGEPIKMEMFFFYDMLITFFPSRIHLLQVLCVLSPSRPF